MRHCRGSSRRAGCGSCVQCQRDTVSRQQGCTPFRVPSFRATPMPPARLSARLRHVHQGGEAAVPALHALPGAVVGVVLEEQGPLLCCGGEGQMLGICVESAASGGQLQGLWRIPHTLVASHAARPGCPPAQTRPWPRPPAWKRKGWGLGWGLGGIRFGRGEVQAQAPTPAHLPCLHPLCSQTPNVATHLPSCSASSSASVLTRPPRLTLMSTAVGYGQGRASAELGRSSSKAVLQPETMTNATVQLLHLRQPTLSIEPVLRTPS